MAILVNLLHAKRGAVQLQGELTPEEFEFYAADEMIKGALPLTYSLSVEALDDCLLIRGDAELPVNCECVRCLKPFELTLRLRDWAAHIPLEGEDAVPVNNDCVDLTPYLREDILLRLPSHPRCTLDCDELPGQSSAGDAGPDDSETEPDRKNAWEALEQFKTEEK